LLFALGALDSCGSKVIKFDVIDIKPRLPYHVAFQIHVEYMKITITRTMIDEGDATCVMFLTYWKAIGFPTLSQSMTILTTFDRHLLQPLGILPAFPVQLGGKVVEVDVEVADAPLNYNLLPGHNWTYALTIVLSLIFRALCFPHKWKIVTIYQLSFAHASPSA